jgi:hypothetical protein
MKQDLTAIPATQSTPPAALPEIPVFELVETDSHYLLTLDLPSAPVQGAEIELQGNELRVLMNSGPAADVEGGGDPGVLFRCKTLGKRVKAVYYRGALWLSLPKAGPSLAPAR